MSTHANKKGKGQQSDKKVGDEKWATIQKNKLLWNIVITSKQNGSHPLGTFTSTFFFFFWFDGVLLFWIVKFVFTLQPNDILCLSFSIEIKVCLHRRNCRYRSPSSSWSFVWPMAITIVTYTSNTFSSFFMLLFVVAIICFLVNAQMDW